MDLISEIITQDSLKGDLRPLAKIRVALLRLRKQLNRNAQFGIGLERRA